MHLLSRLPRPVLTHVSLNLIVAVYVLAVLNGGFWRRLTEILAADPVGIVIFGACILVLTLFLFELLAPSALQKPMLAGLILIAASANYFEQAYGALINTDMMRNIMETTADESRHLFTLGMVTQIALTGVVPALLVFWPHVRRFRLLHQLWRWPGGVAVTFGLLFLGIMSNYQSFSAMLRERHDLMTSYQPGDTVVAFGRYAAQQWQSADPVVQPIGLDAQPGTLLSAAEKPVLLVFFVGETVRAQNWGLNGYERDTTPALRQRDVVNFTQVTSCGTSTAVSVPCMMSDLTQDSFSHGAFRARENLADVLAHAGFDVRWVDNNTGDQAVARRMGWLRASDLAQDPSCAVECNDQVLLPVIEETLATMTRNTVLFLHMIGNHGPAYYLRASSDEQTFLPDCQTASFADCSIEQIVNTYDNAILETDYVLSQAIDRLAAADAATALFYVSDHGESLGENGLFLHAAPMFIAPDEQTHVPMVMWLSPTFEQEMGVTRTCLMQRASSAASHDNVFHTVLGLLDIQTEVRDVTLDLTAACSRA